jgi:hypothetical protein
MTIYTNSGLAMAMESARGAAKTLTAISIAAPGVFTGTHDFIAGDFVLLQVEGMKEVNNRVFQVVSVATTVSFKLEAIDGSGELSTVGYTAFTSGSAYKVTFGTAISGVQEFAPSGGEPKYVDITTVHDKDEFQKVVGSTAKTYGLTMQWDPANAGQVAMQAAFDADADKAFRITWPNGRYVLFYGSVGYSGMPGGASQGVTTTPASVALLGDPTFGM